MTSDFAREVAKYHKSSPKWCASLLSCLLHECCSLLYLPSGQNEAGRYTVFTFVCLSVCVYVHSFEWAESCIVCREMYSTRA